MIKYFEFIFNKFKILNAEFVISNVLNNQITISNVMYKYFNISNFPYRIYLQSVGNLECNEEFDILNVTTISSIFRTSCTNI